MEAELVALMEADAGIGAAIGDRIYAQAAERDLDDPFAVYRVIAERRFPHLGGDSGLALYGVEITVWAATYAAAKAGADAISSGLSGHLAAGAGITSIRVSGGRDVFDETQEWHGRVVALSIGFRG
jgi:hypothetical protein